MQTNPFDCSICTLTFNNATNAPKILPNCGHTICASCLDKILQLKLPSLCPLDRSLISNEPSTSKAFPTNLFVLQMLDDEQKKMNLSFSASQQKIVLSPKSKISQSAFIPNTEHLSQQNKVLTIEELKFATNQKKFQLEEKLKEFQKQQYIQTYDKVNKLKMDVETIIMDKFAEIRQVIDERKAKVMTEIQDYFTHEKQKIDDQYQKDIDIREQMKKNIQILNSEKVDQDFYRIVTEDLIPEFSQNPQYFYRMEQGEKILENCYDAFKHVVDRAVTLTENFEALRFLQEPVIIVNEQTQPDYFLKFTQKEDDSLRITSRHNNNNSAGYEVRLESIDWVVTKKVQLELSDIKITQDFLESFAIIWKDRFSIDDLKLNLAVSEISDRDFQLLWSRILTNLLAPKALEINLRHTKVTSLGVCQLLKQLSLFSVYGCNLSRLQKLSLWLSNIAIIDKPIQDLATKLLPLLTNLEDFQLSLGGTPISDVSINTLVSSFPRNSMSKIHTFSLFLSETSANDKNLTSLAVSLSDMPNLRDLKLGFHGTKITDTGLEQLFIGLKGAVSSLRAFSLYLGNTKITDASQKSLNKILFMTELDTLALDLSGTLVSDASVSSLFSGMKKIAFNLKIFYIGLVGCKIGCKSIEALTKNAVPYMELLESFNLNLSNTNVKDQSLTELFDSLNQNFDNLKSVVLSLTRTKVSDVAMQALNKRLHSISGDSLKELILYLEETLVTDRSILEVYQLVSKFHNSGKPLQNFDVRLNATKVQEQTVKMIRDLKKQLEKSEKKRDFSSFFLKSMSS